MLTALKLFLRSLLAPFLYFGAIYVIIIGFFKKAEWGFFLLLVVIPQPNVWYKLREYPRGKDLIDFLFFAVLFGIIIQKKDFLKITRNLKIFFVFIALSYIALWNSSMRFSLPSPLPLPFISVSDLLKDWKNYVEMILLYFLALNITKDEDKQKFIVVLMSMVVLLIAVRSYRNFTGGASFDYDKRYGGPLEAAGLNANHFGAFISYNAAFLLGFFLIDEDFKRRMLSLSAFLFSLHPLFYSYSRGAYLGLLGAVTFLGIIKKRSLLILVVAILLTWQTVLPASVVDRISMTETESGEVEASAAKRLVLWDEAMKIFEKNPVFGIGFGGFSLSVPEGQTLTDTHNFYMKTLSEQGIIGIIALVIILFIAVRSGWRLFKIGKTPFHKALGFGFIGACIAMIITNTFGDRWSYFALGGFFWVYWGLVDRGILMSYAREAALERKENNAFTGEKPVMAQKI